MPSIIRKLDVRVGNCKRPRAIGRHFIGENYYTSALRVNWITEWITNSILKSVTRINIWFFRIKEYQTDRLYFFGNFSFCNMEVKISNVSHIEWVSYDKIKYDKFDFCISIMEMDQ